MLGLLLRWCRLNGLHRMFIEADLGQVFLGHETGAERSFAIRTHALTHTHTHTHTYEEEHRPMKGGDQGNQGRGKTTPSAPLVHATRDIVPSLQLANLVVMVVRLQTLHVCMKKSRALGKMIKRKTPLGRWLVGPRPKPSTLHRHSCSVSRVGETQGILTPVPGLCGVLFTKSPKKTFMVPGQQTTK
jgi:hypothetical protein